MHSVVRAGPEEFRQVFDGLAGVAAVLILGDGDAREQVVHVVVERGHQIAFQE